MIVGIAVMRLGIGIEVFGGFCENTAIFIAGVPIIFIGLGVVLFNNSDE